MIATIFNTAAKKHVVSGSDIHPFRKKQPKPLTLESLADFVDL